jgi:hypothetical protein
MIASAVALLFVGTAANAQSPGPRATPFSTPFSDTGAFLASCGDFDILFNDEGLVHGVLVVDQDGIRTNRINILDITGTTTYYNSLDPTKSIEGGPGEVQVSHILFDEAGVRIGTNSAGLTFKIVVPGYGPIFMETGEYRLRAGVVVFNSGFNQAIEEDVAVLCDYLR